jgi:hypothetical protein
VADLVVAGFGKWFVTKEMYTVEGFASITQEFELGVGQQVASRSHFAITIEFVRGTNFEASAEDTDLVGIVWASSVR